MYFDDDKTMGDGGGLGGSFNPDGDGYLGSSGSYGGNAGLGGSYSGGSTPGLGGSYGSSSGNNSNSGNLVGAGLGGTFSARDVTVEAVIDPSTGILQYVPVVGAIDIAYENYNVQSEIASILQSRGWSVISVNDTGFSVGRGRKFQITVGVASSYSDSQIVSSMRSDLASVGTVSSVSIVTQSAVRYTNADLGGGSQVRLGGGGDFLSSLGLGVGISTPIVVGAAVLLLILIAKR